MERPKREPRPRGQGAGSREPSRVNLWATVEGSTRGCGPSGQRIAPNDRGKPPGAGIVGHSAGRLCANSGRGLPRGAARTTSAPVCAFSRRRTARLRLACDSHIQCRRIRVPVHRRRDMLARFLHSRLQG